MVSQVESLCGCAARYPGQPGFSPCEQVTEIFGNEALKNQPVRKFGGLTWLKTNNNGDLYGFIWILGCLRDLGRILPARWCDWQRAGYHPSPQAILCISSAKTRRGLSVFRQRVLCWGSLSETKMVSVVVQLKFGAFCWEIRTIRYWRDNISLSHFSLHILGHMFSDAWIRITSACRTGNSTMSCQVLSQIWIPENHGDRSSQLSKSPWNSINQKNYPHLQEIP